LIFGFCGCTEGRKVVEKGRVVSKDFATKNINARARKRRRARFRERDEVRYIYGIPVYVYIYVCAFVHLSFVSDVRNNQKEAGTLKTSRVGM